jgi:beta-lactamase regulating signal transducer with metallopeptidase domain
MAFLSEFIWLNTLSEYFVKSTLVLALAFILYSLCRKQPASLRHFILSVSLIGLLIFPLLSTVRTGWKTGLIPSWTSGNVDFSKLDIASIGQPVQPVVSSTNAPKESQGEEISNSKRPVWTPMMNPRLWNLMKYSFCIIWILGMIFILTRQIFGLYGAYKLSLEAEDIKSSFWHHLLHQFLDFFTIKKKVDLLKHDKVKVPLTWGWFKPVVIMPDYSGVWTPEQRESALYHELSHVKRGDFLVLMLARISLGFFWFNPFGWFIFHLLKKEQEKACDELVLRTGIKPSTYAANLLSIRRSIQSPWNPPATVLGALGRSQLNDRLLAILKQKLTRKEVKMKTKIFFSVLVILTITFLGMARPANSSKDLRVSDNGDVCLSANFNVGVEVQEEQKEKKDQKKTDKKEDKNKKKDVFVWHMDEGEEGNVEVIITDKGKVKSFTLKEPIIIIKKDKSGREIAITSKGKAVDIKKGKEGAWVVKGDALTLHKKMEAIDLGEGSVVTLKTTTKDGQKTIEIEAPAVVLKKIDDSTKHITLKVSEEEGKKKTVVVAPKAHVEVHPDIHLQIKKTELKKIHDKLRKIHSRLSKEMESKTEEEEQALKEMEETLKKMEKKLDALENKLKDITLSIHEEPHHIRLKDGHAVFVKHEADKDETEEHVINITKDKDLVLSFVDDAGDITFLSHIELEKSQKQAFDDAVNDIKKNLPEGYEVKSKFDEDSGMATIKVKGHSVSKDTMDEVIGLLKGLKEKLATKN